VIVIDVELFSSGLIEQILPLGQKCWEENTAQKLKTCAYFGEREFAVEPNIEEYRRLASLGLLILITLRDDGTLMGYVVGIIYESWHHKKIKCGFGDSIYVEPSHRTYTPVLIEKFMKEMERLKVKILGWPTTQGSPVHELLKAMGFVGDDIVMEKRLCA
jgi:hypothetical protein